MEYFKPKPDYVLLVDDCIATNFLHQLTIMSSGHHSEILAFETVHEGMEFLESKFSEQKDSSILLFLDINLPGLNGWDFLSECKNDGFDPENLVIIILTAAAMNKEDENLLLESPFVKGILPKPLDADGLEKIWEDNFSGSLHSQSK
jgi:CheY-like chemotaxis protein